MEWKGEIMRVAMSGFATEEDRWDAVSAARRLGGRRVLLRGANDRRVLPAFVRVAPCAARERRFPFDVCGCRAGRVPALQTLPAQ